MCIDTLNLFAKAGWRVFELKNATTVPNQHGPARQLPAKTKYRAHQFRGTYIVGLPAYTKPKTYTREIIDKKLELVGWANQDKKRIKQFKTIVLTERCREVAPQFLCHILDNCFVRTINV